VPLHHELLNPLELIAYLLKTIGVTSRQAHYSTGCTMFGQIEEETGKTTTLCGLDILLLCHPY
jgi:hypothetical protein